MQSTIVLEYLNGPRKGDILEFPSEVTVRIGRLVRGNTVAIKDPGISSKHLVLQCRSEKWMVEDLDSSNGTFLNSVSLTPLQPYELQDNDIIKLGEVTSLLVRIAKTKPSEFGRGRRKRGQPQLAEIKASTEVNEEPKRTRVTRRTTATRTAKTREENVPNLGAVKEEIDGEASEGKGNGEAIVQAKESRIKVEEKEERKHEIDLKKMTLCEWFDIMESNLRNQIIEAGEEAIEEMKNNGKRVCEYYMEMKKKIDSS